ncbi:MAG TPA: acyl-CoA dehydrogenase family protein [Spongiibacteraceae bacterium]|nr:acyl-CoA dehydrogenase family protein [Spongiibacteraceae bacterium]
MEFRFNEEQQMIRDTAAAFLAEVSDSAAIRRAMATEQGYEDAVWARIVGDMYWQALHIPEQYGGLGLGYIELVALFEQMGRYLLCSPFLSTVAFATNALLVAANDEQKNTWLPQIASGELTGTLAYISPGGNNGPQAVQAVCEKTANGYTLNGTLRYVLDGHTAGLLIVAARTKNSSGEQGISLFAVPADTAGVTRNWLPTMDQTRKQAEIVLQNVALPSDALLGSEGAAWPQLQKVLQLAQIAVAAEQMGGAQQALDISVEYTKGRYQFNRPIASFQGIKHKAADMMVKAESARSAAYYAACVAQEALAVAAGGDGDTDLAAELPEAAAIAKAYCSDAFFFNAGSGIQMHGGVGFTWEYDIQLYFKRAKSTETLLGNAVWHREQLAKMLLD